MAYASARPVPRLHAAIRELLLVAALFLAYKAGRLATADNTSQAMDNADTVWHLERLLHLPNETTLQQALLPHDLLISLANSYYAYVHFPATAACLIWLYLRHPAHYRLTRNLLAWLTAAAFAIHVFFPLAPPRLTAATGLLDTGTLYGPAVYGPPDTDTLSNQYAAMPSLHAGWAVVIALALISTTRGRWRRLWLAHPLITLLVVVTTGNHYWLDAIVAVALLLLIGHLLRRAHGSPTGTAQSPPKAALSGAEIRRTRRCAAARGLPRSPLGGWHRDGPARPGRSGRCRSRPRRAPAGIAGRRAGR